MQSNEPRKMVSFLSGPKSEGTIMYAGPQAQEVVSSDPKEYAQESVPSFPEGMTLPPLHPVSLVTPATAVKDQPS